MKLISIVSSLSGVPLLFAGVAMAAPPAWVDGKDPRYSSDKAVLGVGKGPSRDAADIDARAEIARVFESNVASVMSDFQAAASKVNSSGKGVSVEVQAVAQFQQVTAKKTLSGVEIKERGQDGSTFFALAMLDRKQCANALKGAIEGLDGQIRAAVSAAESAEDDKLKAFKHYGKALNLMDEREGLNAMLRVCDKSGEGIPAPVSMDDLVGHFDEAAGSFRLGLIVEGSGATRVKDCIMEQLGNKGYQIEEISIEDEDSEEEESEGDEEGGGGGGFDAILKGKLKNEKAGEIAGSIMVRTELTLKLINPKTKKTLKTFTGNRKEGRRDVKSSAALSAHKICLQNAPKIVEAIDQYFKR